jgi:hypothetical protein
MTETYRVEVLTREHDNIAGVAWGFEIWIALRKTARYSVGVWYHTNEPPTPRFRTYYPLRSGQEVWDAVNAQHRAAAEWEEPLDLEAAREISRVLEAVDPRMASEILDAATESLSGPIRRSTIDPSPLEVVSDPPRQGGVNAAIRELGTSTTGTPPRPQLSTLTVEQQKALANRARQLGRSLTTPETQGVLAEMEVFSL